MHTSTARPSRAFTLTELLAVLLIVAILAAILFPIGIKAMRSAKRVSCISNLRQLGMAAELYENTNDGKLPVVTPRHEIAFGPYNKTYTYKDPLAAYGMTTELYHCPEARKVDRDVPERSDYIMRFVLYPVRLGAQKSEAWSLTSESTTVIAYCPYHHASLQDKQGFVGGGFFNALKGDCSATQVPSNQVQSMTWEWGPFSGKYDDSIDCYVRFPGEPWPPTVEQIPTS